MEVGAISGFRLRLNAAHEVANVRSGRGTLAGPSETTRATKASATTNRLTCLRDGPQGLAAVSRSAIQPVFNSSSNSSSLPSLLVGP